MGGINITPEQQGSISEDDAFEKGEDLNLEDPKDVRRLYERKRRENLETWRRRGNTVL